MSKTRMYLSSCAVTRSDIVGCETRLFTCDEGPSAAKYTTRAVSSSIKTLERPR